MKSEKNLDQSFKSQTFKCTAHFWYTGAPDRIISTTCKEDPCVNSHETSRTTSSLNASSIEAEGKGQLDPPEPPDQIDVSLLP